MKQVNALVSISYEKAAELVMYGRQLLNCAAQPLKDVQMACEESHKKFKDQLGFMSPARNLWAELKAQRETVCKFKGSSYVTGEMAHNVEVLYDYFQTHQYGLITKDDECPEVFVVGRKTRRLGQFLTDNLSPKKRSAASRYTRSQDYSYAL